MCGELPSLLGTSRDPMWKSAVLADLRDLKRALAVQSNRGLLGDR